MAIIYKITNLINGKIYIGETTRSFNRRWNEHKSQSFNKGHGYYYHLHCAIRKYGLDNFSTAILEECEDNLRFEREHHYILKFNSLDPNGYNYLVSGEGSVKVPIEKIIELWEEGLMCKEIGQKLNLHYQTVSEHLKNFGITQEEINQRKGNFTRQRCSYPIYQYDLEGNFIKEYPSASSTKFSQSAICQVCLQKQISAYGYLWKYKDDPRPISEWVNKIRNKKEAGRPKKIVLQYDLKMNLIAEYPSAKDAALAMGKTSRSNLCSAARKGGKAYGYYWKYKENEE